jgi:hypothetical protein
MMVHVSTTRAARGALTFFDHDHLGNIRLPIKTIVAAYPNQQFSAPKTQVPIVLRTMLRSEYKAPSWVRTFFSQQEDMPTSHKRWLPPDVLDNLLDPDFVDRLLPHKLFGLRVHQPSNFIAALQKHTEEPAKLSDNHAGFGYAYDSTLSGLVDAFYKLPSCSTQEQIHQLLDRAWAEDPETTLKIIWHLRSTPEGNADRRGFFFAFGWLYLYHPCTAIISLPHLVTKVCTRPPAKTAQGTFVKYPDLTHGHHMNILDIFCYIVSGALGTKASHFRKDLSLLDLQSELERQYFPRTLPRADRYSSERQYFHDTL